MEVNIEIDDVRNLVACKHCGVVLDSEFIIIQPRHKGKPFDFHFLCPVCKKKTETDYDKAIWKNEEEMEEMIRKYMSD